MNKELNKNHRFPDDLRGNKSQLIRPDLSKNGSVFVDNPQVTDTSSFCFTFISTSIPCFVSKFYKDLQRRQGPDSGFHFLMAVLKLSSDSLFFKSFGRLSNSFGPKERILFQAIIYAFNQKNSKAHLISQIKISLLLNQKNVLCTLSSRLLVLVNSYGL